MVLAIKPTEQVEALQEEILEKFATINVDMSNKEVETILSELKSQIPVDFEPEPIFSREVYLKNTETEPPRKLEFIKLDPITAVKYYEDIFKLSKNLNKNLYSERSLGDIFASYKTYGDTTYRLESQWEYSIGILDEQGSLIGFVQANIEETKSTPDKFFESSQPQYVYVSLIAVDEHTFGGVGLGANLYYALADLVPEDSIIKGATAAPLENKRIQDWYTTLGFKLNVDRIYGKDHKMIPFTGIPVEIKKRVLDYFKRYKKKLDEEITEQ